MSPFQQAQMFCAAGPEHPQHRHRGRVRRLPGHRQGGQQRPRRSSRSTASARSTRSTGRGSRRRSSTTSRATLPPPRSNERAGVLRRAVGQFRQHLRRPRRAHDGPADQAADPRHQRERRAGRVLPTGRYRPRETAETLPHQQSVDGHLESVQLRALHFRPDRARRGQGEGIVGRGGRGRAHSILSIRLYGKK